MSPRTGTERTGKAPPSLAQLVKERILLKIGDGELRPGDRIIEMRIAAELEISQAPVREAIRELETLGILESSRNRGARVRTYDPAQVQEIYDVRAELESYGVWLILRHGRFCAEELSPAIDGMRAAGRTGDVMLFSDSNADFHRSLMRQSGNGALLELWELLDIKSRTFLNVGSRDRDLVAIADSHLRIIDALSAGDVLVAQEAIRAHILDNSPSRPPARKLHTSHA